MHDLHIGCSGWAYDHWREPVYDRAPQREWLELYAARFPTVEVNTTFYRLPSRRCRWDWRVLINTRLDGALYATGRLDRTLPFEELRSRARLNDIANAAPADGFGDHVRRELEARRHVQ